MPLIDLKPHEYRRGPLREHPLVNKVFRRATFMCAFWFVAVVGFGRLFDHQLPWYLIALPAIAPCALFAYIVISLDD